jgi:RNA polymerase sigma-70 factor (ECF subfamily)
MVCGFPAGRVATAVADDAQLCGIIANSGFVTADCQRDLVNKSPSTRVSLVMRLRDSQDAEGWRQFVEIYAPLIHAYGLHHGLQDADAADLAQEVLQRVATTAGRFEYDPARGTFRGWLFTITRNVLRKMAARKGRQPRGSGDTQMRAVLEEQPDNRVLEAEWDAEYRWNLLHWAAQRVKPEFREATWQAFWLTVIEQKEIDEVARNLTLTVGAVYIARSRVTSRIREVIAAVEGE